MHEQIKELINTELSRRKFLWLAAGLAGAYLISNQVKNLVTEPSKVAVVKVPKYSLNIKEYLKPYFNQFNLNLNGKRVLLKPNLVDFHSEDHYINTNPLILAAAIELFGEQGAKVIVAEASGLRRDTNTILYYTHYKEILEKFGVEFVDLNMDNVEKVTIASNLTKLNHFYIPKTVLDSDFIVSMPKMKTHHWAGVTLSLKNMFGILPGIKYGWPKNRLHTVGIEKTILDINHTIRPHFTIIDGIYGIEGNGPLFGDNKYSGVVVMSNDLVAADAISCKIMGINPEKVLYLKFASLNLDNKIAAIGQINNIKTIGENINSVRTNYKLLDEFQYLRL